MRLRSREAVSGLACQSAKYLQDVLRPDRVDRLGLSGFAKLPAPLATSRPPSDTSHCARCFSLRQDGPMGFKSASARSCEGGGQQLGCWPLAYR